MGWSRSRHFDAVMAGAWLVLGCVSCCAVREGKTGAALLLAPALFGSGHALKLLVRWHRERRRRRR